MKKLDIDEIKKNMNSKTILEPIKETTREKWPRGSAVYNDAKT